MSHEICFYMRRNAYKIYKNDKAEMLHEAYLIFIKMYMYTVLWCIEKKIQYEQENCQSVTAITG